MKREDKKQLVADTNEALKDATVAIVTHYKGMTVAEMTALRGKVRAQGANFKVTQNLLTKRALEGTPFAQLADLFAGPTALAWSTDPVAAAKALVEFAKDNEKLVILGGAIGDTKLDKKSIEQLAKMPSLDELRARLVGMLQTPATRIATILQAPGAQLARVTSAYSKKANGG